jgi:uncharacterized membrane protein
VNRIDEAVIAADRMVIALEERLERAVAHRAQVFARAQEQGRSSADIARLLGAPDRARSVMHNARLGRSLLLAARLRRVRAAAANLRDRDGRAGAEREAPA